MISIIDYKMGNLASLKNAFAKLEVPAKVITTQEEILNAKKLVLPGVGAYPDAMEHLRENGLDEAIKAYAASGKPLIGICLGMQLLFEKSYEFGTHEGLGLIEGEVVKFDLNKMDKKEKIPHMGWNKLFTKPSPLFDTKEAYLYFVHSYHAVTDERYSIGTTHYGYDFVSAAQKGNIFGIQPHPEKSHDEGLKILKNFTRI